MKRWKRHLMIFAVFVFTVFGAQSVMATDVLKVAIVDRSDHKVLDPNWSFMIV